MKVQHEDRYPLSVEAMYGIFCDRQFYEARYARGHADGDARYELLCCAPRGDKFVVDVKQYLRLRAGTSLPAFARRFVREENVLRTTMEWNLVADADGSRRGTHRFHIDGVPVDVKGTMQLRPQGDGCVNRIELTIHSGIPLIGGKIASMLGERAERTLTRNHESTLRYLREHGLAAAT